MIFYDEYIAMLLDKQDPADQQKPESTTVQVKEINATLTD